MCGDAAQGSVWVKRIEVGIVGEGGGSARGLDDAGDLAHALDGRQFLDRDPAQGVGDWCCWRRNRRRSGGWRFPVVLGQDPPLGVVGVVGHAPVGVGDPGHAVLGVVLVGERAVGPVRRSGGPGRRRHWSGPTLHLYLYSACKFF